MKKNKTLLIVNNLELVELLNKESNITFLFPLEEFCVGFLKTFKLDEIKGEAFILVNRILDNESIEKFKILLDNLPQNIKGIVFDDIGVLNVLLEKKSNLTKILFLNHFNANYLSVNAYLEYVDSVVVSTDITKEEVDEILDKAIKPVVIYTFGHINIMYSRRSLISNYNKHFKKNVNNIASITENSLNHSFKIMENNYGTVVYTDKPFNGLLYRDKKNVLYNLINTVFLSNEEVLEILHSNDDLSDKYPYKYLSNKKTIVKIKEEE